MASIPEDIKDAANQWLLRLSLKTPTQGERAEFDRWRASDPRHEIAFRRFELIWQDTAALTDLSSSVGPEDNAAVIFGGKLRIWLHLVALPGIWGPVLGTVVIGWLMAWSLSASSYSTGTAEIKEMTLSDGSHITLGARSALEVHLGAKERRVVLTAGEAFFSIAHDRQRPFIVRVDDKEITVVGTKFDVHRIGSEVQVSVLEGTVQVSNESAARLSKSPEAGSESMPRSNSAPAVQPALERRTLSAGQQARAVFGGGIDVEQTTRTVEPGAWRQGRLSYVDTTLRDIVTDINRYSARQVVIADERAAAQRVSVTFTAGQIDAMLRGLPSVLPVEVIASGANEVVVRSKS
jgi:transmembrane sensor